MQNHKNEGIQGYLTPSKLLSSMAKNPAKSRALNLTGRSYDDKQKPINQDIRLTNKLQNSGVQNSGKKIETRQQQNNFIFEETQNNIQQSRISGRKTSRSVYNAKQYQDYKFIANESRHSKGQQGQTQQLLLQKSRYRKVQDQIPSSNPQIHSLHTVQLVKKLHGIKKNLQHELKNLALLLDETNLHLQSIDKQYEKIKFNILNYTSNYLDSAFKQYKQNMDWTRYEKFQTKGANLLKQINQTIQERQNEIRTAGDIGTQNHPQYSTVTQKRNLSALQEANKKIQSKIGEYNLIINDIAEIRKQCVEMRPTVTEERLRKFQNAVVELGKF